MSKEGTTLKFGWLHQNLAHFTLFIIGCVGSPNLLATNFTLLANINQPTRGCLSASETVPTTSVGEQFIVAAIEHTTLLGGAYSYYCVTDGSGTLSTGGVPFNQFLIESSVAKISVSGFTFTNNTGGPVTLTVDSQADFTPVGPSYTASVTEAVGPIAHGETRVVTLAQNHSNMERTRIIFAGNRSTNVPSLVSLDAVSVVSSVASAPAAPTSLVAAPGDSQVSVAFTAGANNGAAITDYQYQLDGGSWVSAGVTASPVVITGLTNGQQYSIKLRAVNSAGPGAESSVVTATPDGDADGDNVADSADPFPNADTHVSRGGVVLTSIPGLANSSCTIDEGTFAVSSSFPSTIPAGLFSASGIAVTFGMTGCTTGESIDVTIDLGQAISEGSKVYKVTAAGWAEIPGATVSGTTISYTVQDNGPLDQDPADGVIEDPVAVAAPLSTAIPLSTATATPVPTLPSLLLGLLALLVARLGSRRLVAN